jgi:twitching motility protein PilJ
MKLNQVGGDKSLKDAWASAKESGLSKKLAFAFVTTVIGVLLLGGALFTYWAQKNESLVKRTMSEEMAGLTQSLAKNSARATQGDAVALNRLGDDNKKFDELAKSLSKNAPTEGEEASAIKKINNEWARATLSVQVILGNKKDLEGLQSSVVKIEKGLEELRKSVSLFVQSGAGTFSIAERNQAEIMLSTAQQLAIHVVGLQGRPQVSPEVSFKVTKDVAYFMSLVQSFEKGSVDEDVRAQTSVDGRNNLRAVRAAFVDSGLQSNLLNLASAMDEVQQSKASGGQVYLLSDTLFTAVRTYQKLQTKSEDGLVLFLILALVGVVLTVSGLALFVVFNVKIEQERNAEMLKQTVKNVDAFHSLEEEIKGLENGDLTRRATTDKGVTHGIATTLNRTVEGLSQLVRRVRQTALMVGVNASESVKTSNAIKEDSLSQDVKIESSAIAMGKMAQELDDVAQQTSVSSDLAEHAKSLSKEGRTVVRETLMQMNSLREKIQDTSKQFKMLGEASQEIGGSTQLVRRLSSKIQVLALNAGIQAANAGEVGKGFTVVADEVQKMADEVAEAAQRIERLVANIQESTKTSIATMEVATGQVVESARSADKADASLREIDTSVSELKAKIDTVTEEMQKKSEEVTDLALDMAMVKSTTENTRGKAEGFIKTMESMSHSITALQESVDGFTLEQVEKS